MEIESYETTVTEFCLMHLSMRVFFFVVFFTYCDPTEDSEKVITL